jgi:predicted transcriptional regulator
VKPIRADEWRTELESALKKAGDDGLTSHEIEESLGLSRHTVSVKLSALYRSGKIRSGRRYIEGRDGVTRPVPVYVILKEKKK